MYNKLFRFFIDKDEDTSIHPGHHIIKPFAVIDKGHSSLWVKVLNNPAHGGGAIVQWIQKSFPSIIPGLK